jgi:hypothetical protein
MNVQFLGEMLRSATNFHDLIRSMDLQNNFRTGANDPGLPPAEKQRRSLARTAAIMGAGAGTGVAIGAMTHSEKGVLIGALVGSAGGLVIDQILKSKEARRAAAAGYGPGSGQGGSGYSSGDEYRDPPHPLRERGDCTDRQRDAGEPGCR